MPREKMPDIVVLLPGIMGSVLRKEGRTVWGFSGRTLGGALLTQGGRLLEDLRIERDDPEVDDLGDGITATDLMPDVHLMPGVWKIDGYSRVDEQIRQRFDVVEGQNYFRFPYDWRRDNRASARRLQRNASRWLERWRTNTGNADAKLILVAHSMGGIVSRYFIEVLDGWKDTRALITFGTPYRGSLNAVDALANGIRKSKLGLTFVDMSELGRSFDSLYQLLPIYPCYDAGDGVLQRVGETASIPNIDFDRAQDALRFHREIQRAVEGHVRLDEYVRDRYRVHPIVGIGQVTNQSARLDGARVAILTELGGRDLSGDGTVPRVSATPVEYSDDGREMFAATKHASLQNADAVIEQLTGVMTGFGINLGSFLDAPARAIALELEDLVPDTMPVEIRVAARGAADTPLTLQVLDGDTNQPVANVMVEPGDDEWRSAQLAPLPAGAYRVRVSGAGLETAEDVFVVAAAPRVAAAPPRTGAFGSGAAPPPVDAPSRPELPGAATPPEPAPSVAEPRLPDTVRVERPQSPGGLFGWFRGSRGGATRGGGAPGGAGVTAPAPGATPPRYTQGGSGGALELEAPPAPAPATPARASALLSAEAPAELEPGAAAPLDIRIELDAPAAAPLTHATRAMIETTSDIAVFVTVHGSVELVEPTWFRTIPAPAPGRPRTLQFELRAAKPGEGYINVRFLQGTTPLGQLDFTVQVRARASDQRFSAALRATPPETPDDDVTLLMIGEDVVGDRVRYEYVVTSAPLRLHCQSFYSDFFERHPTGGAPAAVYASSIYRRVVDRALHNWSDVEMFQREVRGIGVDLCRQLFDPEFLRLVWDRRDALDAVWVTSREPYIPWELVVLRHPDRVGRAALDDRFLGEYGMVRSLAGRLTARRLRASAWSYVAAEFPEQSYHEPRGELRFLTQTLAARGIQAKRIPPDPARLLDSLADPSFDVLHIACHGEAEPERIDEARLILGDRRTVDGVKSVTIDPSTVAAECDLTAREPIVFLNACETGRRAPSLTDVGGWPRTFLGAGAGAFIGTSWPVREQPAAVFSEAFYDSLLRGERLADAAAAGRAAAKSLGDASWLAYSVYGQPGARVAE